MFDAVWTLLDSLQPSLIRSSCLIEDLQLASAMSPMLLDRTTVDSCDSICSQVSNEQLTGTECKVQLALLTTEGIGNSIQQSLLMTQGIGNST